MSDHPMQPVEFDQDGVIRFKRNAIVRFLLDAGPFDLNQLAVMNFTEEDFTQLAQLIGYSVSGFGDLSYVRAALIKQADGAAEQMRQERGEP